MNRIHALSAALAIVSGSALALADVTVAGDVVVPAGATHTIADNTTYTGSLTLEAGARVLVSGLYAIRFASGATLSAQGTTQQPVVFELGSTSSSYWGGIHLQDGSSATLTHAQITDTGEHAFLVDNASLVMNTCRVFDASTPAWNGKRFMFRLNAGAVLDIAHSHLGPYSARDGGFGADGQHLTLVDAMDADSITLVNNWISGISAGYGGTGRRGTNGTKGTNAPDATIGDGTKGGTGKTGGTGGRGGRGGSAVILNSAVSGQLTVVQNVFETIQAGNGGQGGTGGTGGTGGDGGDGADGIIGDGADGGNGGTGGKGGMGGTGGNGGSLSVIRTSHTATPPLCANNTFVNIRAANAGIAGYGGPGGSGGRGGSGGDAGIGGDDGKNGSKGSSGSTGSTGWAGTTGSAELLNFVTGAAAPVNAVFVNNVAQLTGPTNKTNFNCNGGDLQVRRNLLWGASEPDVIAQYFSDITYVGNRYEEPAFENPSSGGYRLLPGSVGVDAGDSSAVPAWLVTDFDGLPRFMDDLNALGDHPGYPVDTGAFETIGEFAVCDADVNADGVVDNGDIGAFITLFLAQDSAADFTGDGIVDNGDINAFVVAFLAGC